jgi:amino acid transporter
VKRALTLPAIISIIFFNVCGGAYAVEDILAAGPGFAVLLMLVTPLVWSAPIALVCAELGTAIPEEGGYYAWSKRALGTFGAFCQGWWAWLYTFIDIGLYPTMFCDYLAYLAPEFAADGNYWLRKGLMIGMIWIFVLLNLFGARTVGNLAKLFFALVMSPFLILVLVGLYQGLTRGFPLSPVTPLLSPGKTLGPALAAAIPVVLWNYMGWDSVSTVVGEMENPRRDYPRALLISVLVIAGVYVVPPLVAMALLGTENFQWETGAWSTAAEQIVGPWLGHFTSAMGMVSAIGLYAALVLVYSRVPFVMGKDGYLPKALMKTNRWDAPWVSLIVSGMLYTAVILMFQKLGEMASAAVTVYGAMMSLELLSFLVLRRREPTLPRPFRVPGGWCVAIVLSVLPLLCIGTGAYYRIEEEGWWKVVGLALVIMASGPLLYPVAAWWRRRSDAHVRSKA